MFEVNDYRQILKSELEKRCRRNPFYSMRAFARTLGLSSARLSEVLNYKSGLSRENAQRIATKLGYSEEEREYFSNLVEAAHARSQIKRELAEARLSKYRHAQYRIASSTVILKSSPIGTTWPFFSFLKSKGARAIPVGSVRPWEFRKSKPSSLWSVSRLWVTFMSPGEGFQSPMNSSLSRAPCLPKRSVTFTGRFFAKLSDCIDLQSLEQRELGAMIMSLNRSDLPRFREMIREFRKTINQEASKQIVKDSVYCLSTQLFELTPEESAGSK